jgi:thiamine transporter ThiT
VAAGVIAALAVTAGLAHIDWPAWWFLPLAVMVLLPLSLRRGVRSSTRR